MPCVHLRRMQLHVHKYAKYWALSSGVNFILRKILKKVCNMSIVYFTSFLLWYPVLDTLPQNSKRTCNIVAIIIGLGLSNDASVPFSVSNVQSIFLWWKKILIKLKGHLSRWTVQLIYITLKIVKSIYVFCIWYSPIFVFCITITLLWSS